MTIKELKEFIANLPDDTMVLVYDREDFMFTPNGTQLVVSPHHIVHDAYVEKYDNAPIVLQAVLLS